jgi:hypothetical protein
MYRETKRAQEERLSIAAIYKNGGIESKWQKRERSIQGLRKPKSIKNGQIFEWAIRSESSWLSL